MNVLPNVPQRLVLALCLSCCMLGAAQAASVYRWKDASGQVHFSQSPPATGSYDVMNGTQPTTVAPPGTTPQPTPGPFAAGEQKSRERKFIEEAQAARKARADVKARERSAKAEKDQRCAQAQERARIAQQGFERVGGNEFAKHYEEAKKDVATRCG